MSRPDLQVDRDGYVILSNGDLSLVRDDDAIAQHLRIRLLFIKGEWFLDTSDGTDYFGTILKKRYSLVQIRREIYRRALGTEGLKEVYDYEAALSTSVDRQLDVSFEALTENNQLFTLSEVLTV